MHVRNTLYFSSFSLYFSGFILCIENTTKCAPFEPGHPPACAEVSGSHHSSSSLVLSISPANIKVNSSPLPSSLVTFVLIYWFIIVGGAWNCIGFCVTSLLEDLHPLLGYRYSRLANMFHYHIRVEPRTV